MTTTTLPVSASGAARAHPAGKHGDAADRAAQLSPAFALLLAVALPPGVPAPGVPAPGVPAPTLPATTAGPGPSAAVTAAVTAAAVAPSRTPEHVLPVRGAPVRDARDPLPPEPPLPSPPTAAPPTTAPPGTGTAKPSPSVVGDPVPAVSGSPVPSARTTQSSANAHAGAASTAPPAAPPRHAAQPTAAQPTAAQPAPLPGTPRHRPDGPAVPSADQPGTLAAAQPAHGAPHISPPATAQQHSSSPVTPTPAPAQPHLAAALGSLRVSSGTHQLTVQLHPAELGSVQVHARVDHNTLTVTVACADQAARAAVQAALPQLNAQLLAAGLGHSTLTVDANGGRPRQNRPGGGDGTERERRDRTAAPSEGVGGIARRRDPEDLELDRWL